MKGAHVSFSFWVVLSHSPRAKISSWVANPSLQKTRDPTPVWLCIILFQKLLVTCLTGQQQDGSLASGTRTKIMTKPCVRPSAPLCTDATRPFLDFSSAFLPDPGLPCLQHRWPEPGRGTSPTATSTFIRGRTKGHKCSSKTNYKDVYFKLITKPIQCTKNFMWKCDLMSATSRTDPASKEQMLML